MVEIEDLPNGKHRIKGPIKIVENGKIGKELEEAMKKKGLIKNPFESE